MKTHAALIDKLDRRYAIRKILKSIKRHKNVVAVIIFGSQAKGTATLMSDLDICVILDGNKTNKAGISAVGGDRIDISFFDELPIYIRYRVFKEGIPLYIKDEAKFSGILADTLSEFMDFRGVLDEYFRIAYGWKYEI